MVGAALTAKGPSLTNGKQVRDYRHNLRVGRPTLRVCFLPSLSGGSHVTTGTPRAARKTKQQNKAGVGPREPLRPSCLCVCQAKPPARAGCDLNVAVKGRSRGCVKSTARSKPSAVLLKETSPVRSKCALIHFLLPGFRCRICSLCSAPPQIWRHLKQRHSAAAARSLDLMVAHTPPSLHRAPSCTWRARGAGRA